MSENTYTISEKNTEMLEKVLDAVGDEEELCHDAITVAQELIQKETQHTEP